MLSRQTASCTEANTLNSGVALVWFSINQSKALNVSAKLNMFLKMIMHVKPSIARSPRQRLATDTIARYGKHLRYASTIYSELATAPITMPATSRAKKVMGTSYPYLSSKRPSTVMPNP